MKKNSLIIKNSTTGIQKVCNALINGELVAIPTETVYGLAARADQDSAIEKIYLAKKRPFSNPLIIHYKNKKLALNSIVTDERAIKLANELWPGPLTIIGKRKQQNTISNLACSNLQTVGIRVPNHQLLNKIFKYIDFPLAAPSANRYGKISPTSALDVYEELKNEIDYIFDGGKSKVGIESTIIDLSTKKNILLRYGGEDINKIERIIGKVHKINDINNIIAPGMVKNHYQPNTPIRLNAKYPKEGELWLAFGKIHSAFKCISLSLSLTKNYFEAASNLYAMLRKLDSYNARGIAIERIPFQGIGKAINDRLTRAASK